MPNDFLHSFQGEWLKRKRSLASWIVVIGGFFTPTIIIIARLVNYEQLAALYAKADFWTSLWQSSWESMAIFLLPLGVVLSTSLITQIEYKNNSWKQLHTVPLNFSTIFFTKLLVIIAMLLQFFILFNIGIYLSAVIPWLLGSGVAYPAATFPYKYFLQENALYFIDCLPILALQYLLGLQYKNFLVPVGTGFILWVGALAALSWKYGYLVPYTYCMYNHLKTAAPGKAAIPALNIHYMAVFYFILFTAASFII